jgi:hypothetical protein
MYDPDAVWALYQWFGFLPPVCTEEEAPPPLPPHRRTRLAHGGAAAYAESCSRAAVPTPGCTMCKKGPTPEKQKQRIAVPMTPVGLRNEMITAPLMRTGAQVLPPPAPEWGLALAALER